MANAKEPLRRYQRRPLQRRDRPMSSKGLGAVLTRKTPIWRREPPTPLLQQDGRRARTAVVKKTDLVSNGWRTAILETF